MLHISEKRPIFARYYANKATMNISYNWLKRYINLPDTAEETSKVLTSIGLEVGEVEKRESIRGGLEGLVIGEVLTCVPHENSDHLHVTTVSLGNNETPLQIVCGAPNVAAGQKVVVATIGTTLWQGDEAFMIKRSKIRGVESFGMLCAEDEIGVGTNHDGIMVLPAETPAGLPAKEYFHVENDYIIEVDITPNRSDAASHYGVARDLYAYYSTHGYDVSLTKPSVDAFAIKEAPTYQPIQVEVQNSKACPRYTALTIAGVHVAESPEWLRNALTAIGLRPINNVVDATNFVLHEMGQALHAFDADKIKGGKVIVRNVEQGTKFTTLDEIERTLDATDLLICNTEEPMCIAGVFGGKDSGVTQQTTNVFLESAYFDPVCIRKTARRHQLSTDASFRYERGCDPNNTLYVLQRCALLIQELAGGDIVSAPIDTIAPDLAPFTPETPFAPWEVTLSETKVNNLTGKQLGAETIEKILTALEIHITSKTDGIYTLQVPRYRVDVQRDCDVIEDILRIYGYNNVELTQSLHSNLSFSHKPDSTALQRKISEQLTAQGFHEILNNSLTKTSYYEGNTVWPPESSVALKNPLSSDLALMRQTLLYGGLESIQRNANRKNADLCFYEFGNCYHRKTLAEGQEPLKAYSEEMHLAMWITGKKTAQTWVHAEEKTTFYQLHAYVANILRRLGANTDKCTFEPLQNDVFAEGLTIMAADGKALGFMAAVNRKLLAQFDIDNEVFYADLDWKRLLRQNKLYKPVITDLPKFPEVKRDLALLVDKSVQFADLRQAAFETERKLLRRVSLFDVYEGKTLEAGKKSYALSFTLQDPENTLKDKQIENVMSRLQKAFEDKFGARLR